MSAVRVVPYPARNFQVRVAVIGARGGRSGEFELDVSHVRLPVFRVDQDRTKSDEQQHGPARTLLLRRGHTGSTEFYEWWQDERNPKTRSEREVTVVLLDEGRRPVTGWHFSGCHLVGFDYSPLDALDSGVLMETAEVSFDDVRQTGLDR